MSKMTPRFETTMTLLMTVATLSVAFVVVKRELAPAQSSRPQLAAEYEPRWPEIKTWIRELGPGTEPVSLLVFNDFECGGCRRFHSTVVDSLLASGQVSVGFVHLPLPGHRFARSAALAVECAAFEGKVRQMVDALFRNQDSLGLRSWRSIAEVDVGIDDIDRFQECHDSGSGLAVIDSSFSLSQRLNVDATPTVLLNGWRFNRPPTFEEVGRAMQRVLAGRPPT